MITYTFLQHYWWAIISLLAGLLVFLLFVQGGNTTIFSLGKTEAQRKMIINSTGRKWEFTFTTLVTFGGAFFASFPLFYSTSFSGAYWVWMIILFSFVLQAVSYEFQSKAGNLLGQKTYRFFLVLNGIIGPLFLGVAVGTFFTGSAFVVNHTNIANPMMPVVSVWLGQFHGLEAIRDLDNLLLGVAVLYLTRISGMLYFLNNIIDEELNTRTRKILRTETVIFLIFFLSFVIRLCLRSGYAVHPETGEIFMQANKYLLNFLEMPVVLGIFLLGVIGVLFGVLRSMISTTFRKGIWFTGTGTVLTVFALFLVAGYNYTSYYPSYMDLQSSLTIQNSCSSLFTLRVMMYVSFIIPFVIAYIYYAWKAIDRKKIDNKEMDEGSYHY